MVSNVLTSNFKNNGKFYPNYSPAFVKKILIYLDSENVGKKMDSTYYLARNLMKDECFQVDISTKTDSKLAEDSDVIVTRFNPPINNRFLSELQKYDDGKKLFINPPLTQQKYSDKNHLKEFYGKGLLPDTLISSDYRELVDFMRDINGDIISKPIQGFGGKDIKRYSTREKSTGELEKIIGELTDSGRKETVIQRFIEGISKYGDKRINVIFYKPINAILRMPKCSDFICNLKSGGEALPTSITSKDREILEKVLPFLRENKIIWAGIDVLGNYLGEINIISPGLLYRADKYDGGNKGLNSLINGIKNSL